MSQQWFVAVAEHRRDELAEVQLTERGFEVHVPRRWARERTLRGQMKLTAELLISPYFFVKFDGTSQEEYAVLKRERGVAHVLESKPEHPGSIPSLIIDDHRSRERAERANLAMATKRKGRSDLVLMQPYVITRHNLFQGRTGRLIAHSGGLAYLDCDRVRISLPDCDIAPATVSGQREAS